MNNNQDALYKILYESIKIFLIKEIKIKSLSPKKTMPKAKGPLNVLKIGKFFILLMYFHRTCDPI